MQRGWGTHLTLLIILNAIGNDPLPANDRPSRLSWHVHVRFSAAEGWNSSAWLACAHSEEAFVLVPYAIDMPDHVPPAANFSRGHALVIDRTAAEWISDSGRKPITGKAEPNIVAPDGHYSFANFVRVLRNCWLLSGDQPNSNRVQYLEAVFGAVDQSPGSGADSEGDETAAFRVVARSADVYGVPQRSDNVADGEVLFDRIPYLESGRSISIDWSDNDSLGRVPRRIEIRSPDRITFTAEFFDWNSVPATMSNRELLASHVQKLADETLVSRARRVLETYRSLVVAGMSRDEAQQCLTSILQYSLQDLAKYGKEFCFAFKEARLGCLARTGKLDQVYEGVVLVQLPYLLRTPGRSTTCGYIACWCQLFSELKSEERARDLLNDSALLASSYWGPGAATSIREAAFGKSGLANPTDRDWCHLLVEVIDQKQAISVTRFRSGRPQSVSARLDGRLVVASYLDRHFLASVPTMKPVAVVADSKTQKDQLSSAVSSPRYVRQQAHMQSSLADAFGTSHAAGLKSCRTALERGLLPLKENATTRTDEELDQLASSFRETVALWKLADANPEKILSFATTIEWLTRDFLSVDERLPAYLSKRSEQLQWQVSQVNQVEESLSRLSLDLTDPSLKYLLALQALRNDLHREVTNPMAPFFRRPLEDTKWRTYQSEVTKSRESAVTQLRRKIQEIDSEFDRQMKKSLSNSTLRDHLGLQRQQKKYLEVMTCIGSVSATLVRDYCMENFPEIDSPEFGPLRIKQVGINYSIGTRIRVRLLSRLTPD